MTREEAIKMLKSKMDGTVDTSYEWAETVRMAIEALHKTEAQIDTDEWCTDFITCADCRYAGEQIADGRYWCSYHEDYMRYCSDAERRQ